MEHTNANDHWDQSRFQIGDLVRIHYFLDDSPGYSYLKGKTGIVIGKSKGVLSYVQVLFEGLQRTQNIIPGNLERIS